MSQTSPSTIHVGILGGGMTGLSAAKHLAEKGYRVTLLEANDYVGGLAKDVSRDGFTADLGPHYIFSTLAKKVGLQDHEVSRFPYYEELYRKGKFYTFPFGMMKNLRYASSVGSAYIKSLLAKPEAYSSLYEGLVKNYGQTFTHEILQPLLQKWSGAHPEDLSLDVGKRLEPANLDQILFFIKKIVFRVSPDFKDQSRHWVYPHQGVKALFDRLDKTPGVDIHLNERVTHLDVQNQRLKQVSTTKATYHFDYVVSTLPINGLYDLSDQHASFEPYAQLHFRPVVFYFMRYRQPQVLKKLWTWFPQNDFQFYRVSEPKNVLAGLGPADQTQLTVELACDYQDDVWNADPDALASKLNDQLRDIYRIPSGAYDGYFVEKARYVYPVYLKSQDDVRRSIAYQSPVENMFWGGRVGQFKYIFLEECYGIGKKCADLLHRQVQPDE